MLLRFMLSLLFTLCILGVISAEAKKKVSVASSRSLCFNQGRLPCTISCQQGTIYYPDGCCECVCKKNYVKVETACVPASWTKWTSWSKCLKTEWGGLRTRHRLCKARGKDAPGSCVGRGSMSKTCSSVTKAFHIRKNIKDLTKEEVHDLIQAMTKFKNDDSVKGYQSIVYWHGWPGSCPWYHHIHEHADNHCSWHHHPLFLPWHRLITRQLELGLSRHMKNKTLGIPYWDWTDHRSEIPYLIRDSTIYDPVLKKYVNNPFRRTFIRNWHGMKIYTRRIPSYSGVLMDNFMLQGTVRSLLSHDYYHFDEQLAENPHDQIHNCFCMNWTPLLDSYICEFGMPAVKYAAFDPMFMLHHSAMDRLFEMRRVLEESAGVADWTKQRVIGQYIGGRKFSKVINESFDWPLSPFCNSSMNPELTTGRKNVWKMRYTYYGNQLFGYKYTNYDLGDGYTWEDLKNDFKKNQMEKNYWNDDILYTKVGVLTQANCYAMKRFHGCVTKYSNPEWNMTIKWNS